MTTPIATLCRGLAATLLLAPLGALPAQTVHVVNTTADTVDAAPGDGLALDAGGFTSLRAAVQEANAQGGFATIELQSKALYVLALAGAGEEAAATGDLDVTARILLRGFDAQLDAGALDRAFDVKKGGRLDVLRLGVSNGLVLGESGGALRSAGELNLSRSIVSNSAATGAGASGGGIFNDGGSLGVTLSRLFGNDAERAGGAIEAKGGSTVLDRSDFVDNATGAGPGNGGALHLTGTGSITARRCRFETNTASREGGALWNSATGSMSVAKCTFLGNAALGPAADDGGGALFNDGGLLVVTGCDISGNTATVGSGSGGGLFNNNGVLQVTDCTVEDNASARAGGGIEALAGNTVVAKSQLLGNATGPAPGNGGGLHLTGEGTVSVSGTQVADNTATAEGGGLWSSALGNMSVTGCDIAGNTASGNDPDQGGGGLFNDGGLLRMQDCELNGNRANGTSGSGGGVLNNLGMLVMVDCVLAVNVAIRAGGNVECNVGTTSLTDVILDSGFTGSAPGNGGGLHLTGAGFVTLQGGAVMANLATNEGGGLWNSATGTMHAAGVDISGNDAPEGPDVFNQGGTFTVDGVDVPVGP
jgi:CSLREA domain-containing protein